MTFRTIFLFTPPQATSNVKSLTTLQDPSTNPATLPKAASAKSPPSAQKPNLPPPKRKPPAFAVTSAAQNPNQSQLSPETSPRSHPKTTTHIISKSVQPRYSKPSKHPRKLPIPLKNLLQIAP